jgi:hypothetical protein
MHDKHGWPTGSLVGAEAARRAWLVAQHADRQLDLQRRALTLMTKAVETGATTPSTWTNAGPGLAWTRSRYTSTYDGVKGMSQVAARARLSHHRKSASCGSAVDTAIIKMIVNPRDHVPWALGRPGMTPETNTPNDERHQIR